MRLYRRSQLLDLEDTISRCILDADRGYIAFALERLNDLQEELGEDAKIWYAKGTLYLEFLGQGLEAYACFEKAYTLDHCYAFAACNASEFAPCVAKCLEWADFAKPLSLEDRSVIDRKIELLRGKDDVFYGGLQHDLGILDAKNSKLGVAAARIEISLRILGLEEEQEVELRRWRAQRLRELDKAAYQQYATRGEEFAPQDRLALAEALVEIDRALMQDEYDAEMWNFKSAWCYLMGRYEDSIAAADHAIELRPNGYHPPYVNKAQSLRRLRMTNEARDNAQKARQIAQQSGHDEEIASIDQMLLAIDTDPQDMKMALENVGLLLSGIVKAAQVTADIEIGKMGGTLQITVAMFRHVLARFPWGSPHVTGTALDYVPLMAQALAYASPEYWFVVVHEIAKEDSKTYENCILATLYIAAHADPIMQRDALRLLALTAFAPAIESGAEHMLASSKNMIIKTSALRSEASLAEQIRCQKVRQLYRTLILEVSAAATDEMAQLDRLMQQEFARIQPGLPAAIAEQAPIDEADKARARATVLSQLQGLPFIVDPSTPRIGSRPEIPASIQGTWMNTDGMPMMSPTDNRMSSERRAELPLMYRDEAPPSPYSFAGRLGILERVVGILLAIAGLVLVLIHNPNGYWLMLAGVLAWWSGGKLLTVGYVHDIRHDPTLIMNSRAGNDDSSSDE